MTNSFLRLKRIIGVNKLFALLNVHFNTVGFSNQSKSTSFYVLYSTGIFIIQIIESLIFLIKGLTTSKISSHNLEPPASFANGLEYQSAISLISFNLVSI